MQEWDFGGAGTDELVLTTLMGVAQLGACETSCDGVAYAWPAKYPRREQVSHPAGDPRTQGHAARHQTGLHQHPLADRMAFTVVGVEHVVGCACEDRVDLPCQIGGVLDAGVHALPAHR